MLRGTGGRGIPLGETGDRLEPAPSLESAPFDWPTLLRLGRLVLSSLRRRWWLALLVIAAGAGGTALALEWLPRSYHIESRVLVQRIPVFTLLARQSQGDFDSATQLAWDTVHRADNLVAIARGAGLVSSGSTAAAPSPWERLFGAAPARSPEDQVRALVKVLDGALLVETRQSTILFSVDWPDAQAGARLIETALQNFLEARRVAEIATIGEAISVLEGRANELRGQRDQMHQELRKERAVATLEASKSGAVTRGTPQRRKTAVGEEAQQLRAMLTAKRQAIRDLEEFRRRRVVELQGQLAEQSGIYGEGYPSVVQLRRSLEGLTRESPLLDELREQERELEAQYNQRVGEAVGVDLAANDASDARDPLGPPRKVPISEAEDALDRAEARFRQASFRYQALLERIEDTKLDLETARASFKHRYLVAWPAQVPTEQLRPRPRKVIALGAFLSLSAALLLALWLDRRSGLAWDARLLARRLGLRVLAETGRPGGVEALWFALQETPWRSLALVPLEAGPHAVALARLFCAFGAPLDGRELEVGSVSDLDGPRASAVAATLGPREGRGRAVLALEPVTERPAGVHAARAADRIIVCVQPGISRLADVERTVDLLGKERVAGLVVV